MDDLDWCELATHFRQRHKAEFRIRWIALKYGASLAPDFEAHKIVDLPFDVILKVVGHLMTKHCTSLDRSVDEMEILMVPAFQLWLANMPKVIDLTAFMSFSPRSHKYHYFKQALVEISKNAPQVEELLWEVRKPTRHFDNTFVDSEILDLLGKLTQLKTLNIRETFKFRLIDLISLGNQLPRLQSLSIVLEDEISVEAYNQDPIGQELKKNLPNLKVLIFEARNEPEECYFYHVLMLNLPNIHIIDVADESNLIYRNQLEAMTQDIVRPNDSKTRNMRNFKVDANSTSPDLNNGYRLICPLVHHLEVVKMGQSEPERDLLSSLFVPFDHIISLHLVFLPPFAVRFYLKNYGKALQTLSIVNLAPFPFSPYEILTFCPRLEKLVLRGELLVDAMRPTTRFTQLKELELNLYFFSMQPSEFPLAVILEAPNLEKLMLGEGSEFMDIGSVTALITEKKILQRLKSLIIYSNVPFFSIVDLHFVRDMIRFIKCAVDSLPALTKVIFDLDTYHCGYSLLAKSLREGRLTNEEIPGITQFFQDVQLQNIPENDINQFYDEELTRILDKSG
ncbi:Hypothetical predicted protein [Cloeon dipterum]|nr:Hypothetical predicted protein [Cloeon dipterum]